MSLLHARSSFQSRHPLMTGIAAGLLAGAVTAATDRVLERMVSKEQKRRDRRVRKAPPHKLAGPFFAQKLLRRKLSRTEKKRAQLLFSLAYGVGWGIIHSKLRARFPRLAHAGAFRFGLPFFLACDGLIAPLLRISPNLRRIPWQMSAKELGNHVAWSAVAEIVHRAAKKK